MNRDEVNRLVDELTNESIQRIAKAFVGRLESEGTILSQRNVRSYLKINYEVIYNCLLEISPNSALSLSIIKEIIDDCDYNALFNTEQYMVDFKDYLSERDEIPDLPLVFLKFIYSFLAHLNPIKFTVAVI